MGKRGILRPASCGLNMMFGVHTKRSPMAGINGGEGINWSPSMDMGGGHST
jgi:hypothetical protein